MKKIALIILLLACVFFLLKAEDSFSNLWPNIIIIRNDQTHEEILSYWTYEKMGAAAGPFQTSHYGNDSTNRPVSLSTYYVSSQIYRDPIVSPYNAIGMIFFTIDGRDRGCTGTAIGEIGVVTASACISNGREVHARNWIFIPGLRYWEREESLEFPYGIWTAHEFMVKKDWHENMDYKKSIAGALMRKNNNRFLSSAIGGSLRIFKTDMENKNFEVVGYEFRRGNPPQAQTRQTSSGWAFKDSSLGAPMPNCIHNTHESHFRAPHIPGSPWIVKMNHGDNSPYDTNWLAGVTGYAHRHSGNSMTWQCSPDIGGDYGVFLQKLMIF